MGKPTRRRTVIAIALALMLTSGSWAALQLSGPDPRGAGELQTVLWPQPHPVGDLDLVDHQGEPFGEAELRGRWSLIFFGYTRCPDVCPTTLAAMSRARDAMTDQGGGETLQLVFVTLDPQRDTVAMLGDYVAHFDERLIGVTGEQAEIDALAERLAVMSVRHDQDEGDGGYHIDHTASVLLVDPQARVRGAFPPPHRPERIARQLLALTDL